MNDKNYISNESLLKFKNDDYTRMKSTSQEFIIKIFTNDKNDNVN